MIRRAAALALPAALAAALALAAPAAAQRLAVDDPAGDKAEKRGLDITRVALTNDDYRIVAKVSFAKAVRGDLIVSIDPRGARGVRLISRHRPQGETTSFVVRRSFQDQGGSSKRVPCRGFRARWLPDSDTARLVLPSRCLHRGDYGAIRFQVLTERTTDTDFAPEQVSAWVPRG